MINENDLHRSFESLFRYVGETKPLVHCITHPITMNDCANLILAVGGSPNMASHPGEVEEVVAGASVLSVNLGNISDDRMAAMEKAGRKARALGIPILIDAVGVACSTLRRNFAASFIEQCRPAIIKGNSSEIRAICGLPAHSCGVDAGASDAVTEKNFSQAAQEFAPYAAEKETILMVSGPVDVVTDGTRACGIANGTPVLAKLTGTGCMLGALASTYLAARRPWEAAVLAAVMMGIAGEQAEKEAKGMGSFHTALFDAFSAMTADDVWRQKRIVM